MNAFSKWIRRVFQTRPLALALVVSTALAVVFVSLIAVAPAAAQNPACSDQIVGTRLTLPAMTAGQEAVVPSGLLNGATALCVEGMEAAESIALKLKGTNPYTAEGNSTALTVDAEFATNLALSDPSFNGSLLKAAPGLPAVTIIALSDLTEGVTVWVGNPRPTVIANVKIDQWQDIKIPGNISELAAGTTKWSGNGVLIVITSGAAFAANGTAVLPEPTKVGRYEFYVDSATQLVLAGTVPGQRFYLSVDADTVTADSWLQRRVEPTTATTTGAAASTAGAQYTDLGGACFSAATCSAAQAVACVSGAPKLPCTPGDSIEVWGAPAPMTLWEALQLVK
ncbi:MAG TPA: hypothetical protein PKG71_00620 [Candidatus Woesebacteria bacterium]|nr:hypothetical protein [Candidatus Woesebacteria bacterium]HNS94459.1 hypothetical protein [Candidatus Woesebacteria bacterium]